MHSSTRHIAIMAAFLAAAPAVTGASPERAPDPLRVEEYVAPDSTNFHVVSTIISGPTEALLVDAQNSAPDGRRVADRIAATGKRLAAIFITHPDHDHYTGTAAVLERFPGTPVYMAPAGLAAYAADLPRLTSALPGMKARLGANAPDSFVTARALPAGGLTVDGQQLTLLPDLQGDVARPTNSALWIPSTRTLIAGDVVFSGIHPWLGASTAETRAAWRQALDRLAALPAVVVVPGHKPSVRARPRPSS